MKNIFSRDMVMLRAIITACMLLYSDTELKAASDLTNNFETSGQKKQFSRLQRIRKKKDQKSQSNLQKKSKNVISSQQEGEETDKAEMLFEKGFNKEAKKRDAISLVNKALNYLNTHDLSVACDAFTHSKDFLLGELYIFVVDTKGIIYAYGQKEQNIWKNWYEEKDQFGSFYLKEIIKKAQSGGGWTTYEFKDSVKSSYVKLTEKNGVSYVVGCGFYAHSKSDLVKGLVQGAVAFFNEEQKNNRPVEDIFSTFSYPLSGRFAIGDLYLYALDFDYNIVAQGDRPGLIGNNAGDYKDANGVYINKEIVKKLKEKKGEGGIWIEYLSKRAPKQTYAMQVTDTKGKNYFIACGFYPDADKEKMTNLVARGYQYMKSHGVSAAIEEFSSRQTDDFRYGDLYLFVYDLTGKVIAHGANDEFIGRNQIEAKDDEGDLYVKELINTLMKNDSENNSIWMNHRFKNAFQSIYAEKVKMGNQTFVIGSGIYPLTKRETMMLLVKSGLEFFQENDRSVAFKQFSFPAGAFIRGELGVFVLDTDGTCYVWSDDMKKSWKNLKDWQDDEGRTFIQTMINAVEHGPAKVYFTLNKRIAVAHVEKITKDEKEYIIGSSFYL